MLTCSTAMISVSNARRQYSNAGMQDYSGLLGKNDRTTLQDSYFSPLSHADMQPQIDIYICVTCGQVSSLSQVSCMIWLIDLIN